MNGPDFEMPDRSSADGNNSPHSHASARGSVRTWSAPRDMAIAPIAPAAGSQPAATVVPADGVIETAGDVGTLTGAERIKRFVLAGKAVFTLQGACSRYTFKVSKSEGTDRYPGVKYFVSLLTGPDNLNDYTYAGMLDSASGQLRPTAKSAYTTDSTPIKAFTWYMGRVWQGKETAPARFYHVGRCGRCGRALTVPSSIETGLGPECAGKLGE